MKILKISQNPGQSFMKFDKDARVEIIVEDFEIESNSECASIISRKDIGDGQKIALLKEACIAIAYQKIYDANIRGVNLTVDGLSSKDINIDRIRWNHILHPEIEE